MSSTTAKLARQLAQVKVTETQLALLENAKASPAALQTIRTKLVRQRQAILITQETNKILNTK